MSRETPTDFYLSCSTHCGNTRRNAPQGADYGDARMGGETTTSQSGNEHAAAVEQQDVADDPRSAPWVSAWIILLVAVGCWALVGMLAWGIGRLVGKVLS